MPMWEQTMTDQQAKELRAILDVVPDIENSDANWRKPIYDAARERLAQLEGKALVIEPEPVTRLVDAITRFDQALTFDVDLADYSDEVYDAARGVRDAMPEATK